MFQAAAVVLALAAQDAVPVLVPYLEIVEQYGLGTEELTVEALRQLRFERASQAFDELDRACVRDGTFSCGRLYPRVLALHIAALVASNPVTEHKAISVHVNVVLRLIARLDDLEERRLSPALPPALATQGRHLLVWAMQFHRNARALAGVLDALGDGVRRDVELLLARAYVEEMRAAPDVVATVVQQRNLMPSIPREATLAQEEARQLNVAARAYERVLAIDGALIEAHVRLARIQARLGRLEAAETRLRATQELRCDRRQRYLIALFLADVLERRGHRADSKAAYLSAQAAWPDAQASAIGLARLRALDGALAEARSALRTIRQPPRPGLPLDRSDPWLGYDSGQAWRLPDGMRALQGTFEPLP